MAINTFEKTSGKIELKLSNSSRENLPTSKLCDLSMFSDDNLSSADSRSSKANKNKNAKSPYLTNESTRLSRIKEKKLMHKRATNIVSSFPLATHIYKANSDEFKSTKNDSKKVKKSVLTLPNEPASIPQVCTVSDMNDSEYFSRDGNKKSRVKKRFQAQKGKARSRNKDYEFYDRDARFCSQMNIDLNCSSTDIMRFPGDYKRSSNKYRTPNKQQNDNDFKAHDVWAVLRNINRFQFRPSPPMSDDDSVQTPKKTKIRNKRRNNINDRRVIETRRTEEFAYISSYDFQSKSPHSFSQTSSFDRITVIDKQEELTQSISHVCHELENTSNKRNNLKGKTRRPPYTRKSSNIKNSKTICPNEPSNQLQYLDKNQTEKNKVGRKENDLKGTSNNNQIKYSSFMETETFANTKDLRDLKDYDYDEAEESNTSPVILSQIGSHKEVNKDSTLSTNMSSCGSHQNINGITKVILSKGQNANDTKRSEQIKKPRLLTTMPNTSLMPRLTTAEIKRRIAKMKFPIVILGKDQLGVTSIRIESPEHPQFEGLEQRMWPFMRDWYIDNLPVKDVSLNRKARTEGDCKIATKNKINIQQTLKANKNEIAGNKLTREPARYSNITKHEDENDKKKFWKRSVPPNKFNQNKQQPTRKPKPVQHLQDTVLKLLYKKTSVKSIEEQFRTNDNVAKENSIPKTEINTITKSDKADISTDAKMDSNKILAVKVLTEAEKLPTVLKPSWTKGKWASDFIENVIRKIRDGVYYNQENINLNKTPIACIKEASIQTLLTSNDICIEHISKKDKDVKDDEDKFLFFNELSEQTNTVLPGFDESPPALEIKTLNMKEISIHHRTANVTVQFDVTHLLETEYQNRSHLMPVAVNESHTKIFKCKTTILNAALPAELCSILPMVLKIILDSAKQQPLPMLKPYQKEPNLYTISELNRNECLDVPQSGMPMIIGLSSEIKKFYRGVYPNKRIVTKISKVKKPLEFTKLKHCNVGNVLPALKCIQQLFPLTVHPFNEIKSANEIKIVRRNPPCTALQLYKAPEQHLAHLECVKTEPLIKCTVSNLLKQMWNQNLTIRFKMSMPLSLSFETGDKVVSIHMVSDTFGCKDRTSNVTNSMYPSLLKHTADGVQFNNTPETSIKIIKNSQDPMGQKVEKKDSRGYLTSVKKRYGFGKLYKKCKSTSNIAGEKCSSSLNKITNLDEFFQVLGTGKIMSSVFDDNIGKKILSAIFEMKNYITDISQRQAMLILLLTNKKDTPNLVRFRPLLLQGIAVNRITRASELDMEIEVIERENFNRFSQFEGIPYQQETAENPESLFEELYWIAKTTASDYQKPFNESSEKLLKSLLEKRKKLNPSYLRVMARYVGLGLLKTPRKK